MDIHTFDPTRTQAKVYRIGFTRGAAAVPLSKELRHEPNEPQRPAAAPPANGAKPRLETTKHHQSRSQWRLRAEEKRQLDHLLANRAKLAVPLSTVFVLFSALDWMVYPQHANRWLIYRTSVFGLVCFLDWLAALDQHRRGFWLAMLYSFAYATAITLMTAESGGFTSGYYVGLLVLAVAIFVLFPMDLRRGALILALILGPYFIVNIMRGGHAETWQILNNATFLFATAGFLVLGGHLSSQLLVQHYRDQARMCGRVEQLEDSSRRDPLTDLFNRRFLNDYLNQKLSARAEQTSLTFAIADLDHFKCVNDRFGHQAGDKILTEVAHALRDSVRSDDVVFRYGGEEFAIIFSSTGANEARIAAERLRAALEKLRLVWQGQPVELSASIGVTTVVAGDSPEALIRRADQALYRAKGAGRNQIVVA